MCCNYNTEAGTVANVNTTVGCTTVYLHFGNVMNQSKRAEKEHHCLHGIEDKSSYHCSSGYGALVP